MADSVADAASPPYGGKGPLLLGVTWAEMGLTLILIVLRAKTASLYPPDQRSSGVLGLRYDFIWVVVAFAFAVCAQSFMTVSVRYGLGNHQDLLSDGNIIKTNLWSWMAQIVAILCLVVSRIAVIAFLLSLQARTMQKSRILLYSVGAAQAIINVVEVVLILRQCDPPARLWDTNLPGKCDRILVCSQVGYLQGSIGAAADLFLAFYPVYLIGRLQHMKLTMKISLCLIMGGGLIAGIAGINKTIAIASITNVEDLTYAIYKLDTWVLTEMWFIIIFGSIPVLRPFFVRFTQDIKKATGYSSAQSHTNLSGYIGSRGQQEPWLQLQDCSHSAWVVHRPVKTHATDPGRHRDGTDTPESTGEQIWVTKDTIVSEEIPGMIA